MCTSLPGVALGWDGLGTLSLNRDVAMGILP